MFGPRLAPLVTVVASVFASAGAAQTISSPYEFLERKQDLGPFAAYIFTDRGSADLGPKGALMAGLQYGLRLTGPIQLDAYGGYWPTERDVIQATDDQGAQVIGTADLPILLLALRLQLNFTGGRTWHNLVPQLSAGVGLAFDLSSEPSCVLDRTTPDCQVPIAQRYRFGNTFMGQFGLGVIWILSQRIGARLTVEDYLWRIESPIGFRAPDTGLDPAPPEKQWTNNIVTSLGLSYWF